MSCLERRVHNKKYSFSFCFPSRPFMFSQTWIVRFLEQTGCILKVCAHEHTEDVLESYVHYTCLSVSCLKLYQDLDGKKKNQSLWFYVIKPRGAFPICLNCTFETGAPSFVRFRVFEALRQKNLLLLTCSRVFGFKVF